MRSTEEQAKAMCYQMQTCFGVFGLFFFLLIYPSFLFWFFSSCLSRSSCNHCYSSFHDEIVLPASQILFMLLFSILFSLMSYSRCFIHFNQLGFKSRQYLAGKCTSTQNLTHFCHLFTSGRSHQVLSQLFKNCLQEGARIAKRLSPFLIYIC